jgi:hypothetical protein
MIGRWQMKEWYFKSYGLLKKLGLIVIAVIAILNIPASPFSGNARADGLTFDLMATTYDSGSNFPNSLIIVNPANGSQALLGEVGSTQDIMSLDWDPITGRLFGASSGAIKEINQLTGQSTAGSTIYQGNDAQYIYRVAFSPNGVLYGWSFYAKSIGIIDLNNSTFSPVFSTPSDVSHVAMDFAPDGSLYAVYEHNDANFTQTLVSINLATSQVISEKTIGNYTVDDIDFAPDGFIYATNFSWSLIKINPINGQMTVVGYGNVGPLRGIASSNTTHTTPVPPAPGGLSGESGNGQATLSWNAVNGASSYNLYYSTTPGVTKATGTEITGVTSPRTVSPLTNGTPYYFVVTAVDPHGESSESDEVSVVPSAPSSAYSLNDLAGNWASNGLASGPGAPWWERASITVLADGSFSGSATDSSDSTENISGTFNITSGGIITLQGNSYLQCAMDAGKTLVACTDTWTTGSPGTAEMKVMVKKGGSYGQSDLTGTWVMNQLGTVGPHWARGSFSILANGSFTASVIRHDNASPASLGGTAVMGNSGTVTVTIPSLSSTAQCVMDADKTVFVCTETTNGETILSIYTQKTTGYTLTDLAGPWNMNTLISPQSWWGRVFPLTIQSNGNFEGTLQGSDGVDDIEHLSGTFTISNDGMVTGPSLPFTCAMDSGKTVMACTGTGSSGNSNLMIAAKQAQAPAKTLTGLAVTSGASSVNEGGGATYGATAYWSDGSSSTVTPVWSVSPNTYASINSSSGALTTVAVSGDRAVSVRATYSSGGITLVADRKVTIVDLQDTLTVNISGTGAGSVHSISPVNAISCTYPPLSGICSTTQSHGTSLELAPSPDGDSVFSGWSGACNNKTGNCTVALSQDKNVSATFITAPLAMIGTTPYDTLQAAYSAAAISGSSIMLKEGDLGSALGTLNANAYKSVTIRGGYNSAYSSNGGSTVILGPLNLGLGSVILDNVGVK